MPASSNTTVQSAHLVIWGSDFNPEGITRWLNIQPSQSWRKGDCKTVVLDDGCVRQLDSTNEWSGWKYWHNEAKRQQPLVEQVQELFGLLHNDSTPPLFLKNDDVQIEVDCFISRNGTMAVHMPPDVLKAFAGWNVGLSIAFSVASDRRG